MAYMITSMIGTNAASTSISWALSTRNAGLNRPSEKIAAIEIAHQNGAPSSARSLRRIDNQLRSSAYWFGGSLTPMSNTPIDANPGNSAIQNTSLKSSPLSAITTMAASGPATAPTV